MVDGSIVDVDDSQKDDGMAQERAAVHLPSIPEDDPLNISPGRR